MRGKRQPLGTTTDLGAWILKLGTFVPFSSHPITLDKKGGVFGLRRHVAALELADMSASGKARSCPRTPNQAAVRLRYSRKFLSHNRRQGRSRWINRVGGGPALAGRVAPLPSVALAKEERATSWNRRRPASSGYQL